MLDLKMYSLEMVALELDGELELPGRRKKEDYRWLV